MRLQPVIWTKGTFLSPQHLQLQDRFLENVLQFQLENLSFRPWGFRSLQISQEALDGGTDGLDFYRAIIPSAPDYLEPGGWLLFEVGIGQAEQILGLFTATGRFTELFTAKDPAGIERVVGGRFM